MLSSTATIASTHGDRSSSIVVGPVSRRTRGNNNSAAFHVLPVVTVTNGQSQRPLALTLLLFGHTTNSHGGSARLGHTNITILVTATSRTNSTICSAISLFGVLSARFRVVIPRFIFLRCGVKRYRSRGTRRSPVSVRAERRLLRSIGRESCETGKEKSALVHAPEVQQSTDNPTE